MAIEPPVQQLRLPDQAHSTRNPNSYKPQQGASSESSDNSSKLQRIEAIHVAISEEELDWARKIISLEQFGEIAANLSQMRRQIRTSSGEVSDISTTGESSPGPGVHPTKNLNHFDGAIAGNTNSNKATGAPINNENNTIQQMTQCDKENTPEVTTPVNQQENNIYNSSNIQSNAAAQAEEQNSEEERESIRRMSMLNQGNNQDNEHTPYQRVEVVNQEQMPRNNQVITDENVHGKTQVDQAVAAKQNQEWTMPKTKEQDKNSMAKQHNNGEKVIWKVKDNNNPRNNTIQQSKEDGRNQQNISSMEAGQSMKLQLWTPTFKPAEETPIVPIWITLPELPWHCHYMDILTPLLSPIGKALYLDSATMHKTRGSVAKVRVQIDITRERPQHVWLGFSEKDPNLGKWQIIEYEDVPSYCIYCKHHGHVIGECPLKEKDEEIKKNKDQEAAKKSQEKQSTQHTKGIQP
ncbi:myb-like protein I [Solanum tuberosum]|uniref:myb-like protein I n=1 Tax=Solanum tuberosum TaxID=4113 RepID=UPI00073A4961|nr:PREDICTED: myb-like protein I [Solanum tuberosum]